jgi:hypothetical protein
MSTCSVTVQTTAWLLHQAPTGEPSTSLWGGALLDLLLCFSPHRPPPSSHHTCVLWYVWGDLGRRCACEGGLAVPDWAFPSEAQFNYSPGPRPLSIGVDQAKNEYTLACWSGSGSGSNSNTM